MNNLFTPYLHIAVPLLNELELLPRLIDCIRVQTYLNFRVYFCVNQPDEWWNVPERRGICEQNLKTVGYLKGLSGFDFVIIDKCSSGQGWQGKRHGVGWARKILMDTINEKADGHDLILSLDADVIFSPEYFQTVAENFSRNMDAVAMAVPYYHKRVPNQEASLAMLRYEIYMRYYSINLWRISSPYSFTALGSAMVCTVRAYRSIGGLTPKLSGEDFYFLQKLRKFGKMIFWNGEKVFPEARFSTRVYFGTGPAMIKGNSGDWSSYPIYAAEYFDEIDETYRLLPSFFQKTRETKVVSFLKNHLREEDPFSQIRENARELNQFIRACHEKFDGLRILQYLKFRHSEGNFRDEDSLNNFLVRAYGKGKADELGIIPDVFSFSTADVDTLDNIRNFLTLKECEYQINSEPSLPGQQLPLG